MGSLSEQIKEPLYYYVIDKVRSMDKQNNTNAPAFKPKPPTNNNP